MRYYRQIVDNQITALYAVENGDVPKNCEEIGEATYAQALNDLAEADKAARENAERKAQEELEARQKEAEERQKAIDDYASKVKAGTVKIDDVPEDFKTAVDAVVNPPKTDAEKAAEKIDSLQKQVDATTEALNSILMTIAQ